MQQSDSDLVTRRVWLASAIVAAVLAVGIALFFLLGDRVPPFVTTLPFGPRLTA